MPEFKTPVVCALESCAREIPAGMVLQQFIDELDGGGDFYKKPLQVYFCGEGCALGKILQGGGVLEVKVVEIKYIQ